MKMTDALRKFISEHKYDDPDRLLFSAALYPDVNVPFAVEQIAIRHHIRDKLPTWLANENIVFPSKITIEQCSSEQAAVYKQRLIESENHLCDLTGGLGVDSWFFSQILERVSYVERNADIFTPVMHNFSLLNAANIRGYNQCAENWILQNNKVDVFYIDPSRRSVANRRVFALSDCEPDLLKLYPKLLDHAPKIIAKLSPMLDIRHTLKLLSQTSEVHVVSVRNECKELLFMLKREMISEPRIYCVNFTSGGKEQHFSFQYQDEDTAKPLLATSLETYLYEPNSSVLKAGAYKYIARQYKVSKLHVSSHLYTSSQLYSNFPGRIFHVRSIYPFSGKLCKTINRQIPKANISVRNFPVSVSELRNRTHITEGGEIYLFATTLFNGKKVLISCNKVV